MKQIENGPNGEMRMSFTGKLVSQGQNELINTNGKKYKIVNIEFEDINKQNVQCSAAIYEGNYRHGVTNGQNYLCVATISADQQVYVQMSHLESSAGRPAITSFLAEAEATAPAATKANLTVVED